MNSCWLIEYEDGFKLILSEEEYKQESELNRLNRKGILCESHYFDTDVCKQRNPNAKTL